MESQKPTRDERNCVISMAEAGFNIMLFFILIFIKQLLTEYSIISCKQSWLATARDQADKKTNSTGLTFHSDHIKTGDTSESKPALYNI